ncbi:hypothetical protein [Paludibacterium purpuratum]|uniref:Uncharacterized protein n=1 Tax=Paludibacterium purpuratum TaxID=1144873 RepID=A0A4R7B9N3_9NEIS|nr:hypothetical protein [Paludibacterium purpuratum]TDR81541.1 hypothetical protein DFP86_103194 [Paludibacterium purpuratum]
MGQLWRSFWMALQEAVRFYFAPRMDSHQLVRIEYRHEDSYRRNSRRRF